MSGGSMNYLYILVRDAEFHTHSPERKAFREHLMLVANALRAIEWNDSGDGDDQEVHNIMACISLSVSENDMLRAENARLRADVPVYSSEIERLRGEMPVAESLRVDAKCAEIERDEARAVVWKQAKDNADLRAEVERLREVLEVVRIDGPDAQSLVWLSFSREGGVRVSFVVGHKERMVSQALLEFEQIRRKALETKP
jgi:regulator of replication initiation timing